MVLQIEGISTLQLMRTDLFKGLNDCALAKIAQISREEVFDAGEFVFLAHEKAENVYLVLEGTVAIEIETNDIRQHAMICVDTVRRGSVFSWSALVEPHALTASSRCLETTRVITIDGSKLTDVLEEFPDIGFAGMKNLSVIMASRLTGIMTGLQSEIRQLLIRNW